TVVGRIGDVGLEDRSHGAGTGCRGEILDVFVIGADIADMRKGEGDDLAGIGGIGEDFLVAGERRVETDLGDRRAGGACASALDHRPVGQNEQCGWVFRGPGRGHGRLSVASLRAGLSARQKTRSADASRHDVTWVVAEPANRGRRAHGQCLLTAVKRFPGAAFALLFSSLEEQSYSLISGSTRLARLRS